MNKLLKNLKFPAISLVIITIIYGGLTIENLLNQTKILNNKNQTISSDNANLQVQINQIQTKLSQVEALADKKPTNEKNASGATLASEKTIETKTNTITNTITQEIEKNQATVTIENIGSFKVDLQEGDNAFLVLKRAAEENSFPFEYKNYSFGVFITSIGNIAPKDNQFWAFYFNGAFSQVGASDQPVKKGDSIFWQLTTF